MRVLKRRVGHPPSNEELQDALAHTRRVVIVDDAGVVRGERENGTVTELAEALRVKEGGEAFEQQWRAPSRLALQPVGELRILPDGSVDWDGWSSWAELVDPRRLFAWLAEAGLAEPLAAWDAWHAPSAAVARAKWREHIPAPLSIDWDPAHEEAIGRSFESFTLQGRLIDALGSEQAAMVALLAWYGFGSGPIALRPDYQSVPRLLLNCFGFDPIVAVIPSLESEDERAGAARWLLDAAPLAPILARPMLGLPEATRQALVAVAHDRFGASDAERLRRDLFPEPLAVPPGTTLIGASHTRRLVHLVSDGSCVYAVDGYEVVRFEGGERSVLASVGEDPRLGLRDGALLIEEYGAIHALGGGEAPRADEAARARARARAAGWRPPPRAGLSPIAPSEDELEAYQALAHLGIAEPPAARLAGRAYLDPEAHALVWCEPEGERRIALDGRPIAAAACQDGVVIAVAKGERVELWRMGQEGQTSRRLDVAPDSVRRITCDPGRIILVVYSGKNELVLAVDDDRTLQ